VDFPSRIELSSFPPSPRKDGEGHKVFPVGKRRSFRRYSALPPYERGTLSLFRTARDKAGSPLAPFHGTLKASLRRSDARLS